MPDRTVSADAIDLPIREEIAPEDQPAVAAAIANAAVSGEAVYPLGGRTSLEYGLPPAREGIGLDLTGLSRVIDYAARDMTITVEAGIRMRDLVQTLAGENQQLPIDAPCASEATLGGVIATNVSGPRRYGHGTLRDYVIGITAVDGRGVTFQGGGRVVKNVAGYDFCKLLIGSLGTLAVVTQVTLKVKPIAPTRRWLASRLTDWDQAERVLEALVSSGTAPAAIELLSGARWAEVQEFSSLPAGSLTLAVLFEGSPAEVDWQVNTLHGEWAEQALAGRNTTAVNGVAADRLLGTLAEFPHAGISAGEEHVPPLVVKAAVPSSQVTHMARLIGQTDPESLVQCHAGNGVAIARFGAFDAADLTRVLVGRLQSAALKEGGSLTVLRSTVEGLTRQIVWGSRQASFGLMQSVKDQFDPQDVLNPGRFIFH